MRHFRATNAPLATAPCFPPVPGELLRHGSNGTGVILSGVTIPADTAIYWSSGTVPSAQNSSLPVGSRERFGNTTAQALTILTRFVALLNETQLSLADAIFMRVYLTPDPFLNGTVDYNVSARWGRKALPKYSRALASASRGLEVQPMIARLPPLFRRPSLPNKGSQHSNLLAPWNVLDHVFSPQGWFSAYNSVMALPGITPKVARSTMGVPALVNPEW